MKGGAEFADDEAGDDYFERKLFGFGGTEFGEADEEFNILGAGLAEHEFTDGTGRAGHGFGVGDVFGKERLEGVVIDAFPGRSHDEEGEKEG